MTEYNEGEFVVVRTSPMDAATPKTLGDHSHVVRLVTALMRLAPGAILPDHEHVKIEQTYMLEGKLVDKEGPVAGLSVGPGEFVWREARTRHVAWTPDGGLMLAMFQVPNKFFEADGRVTDISGAGWDSIWGHVL
jgi:anti-sigma factor ChrR (cupin superfamily)